MFRENIINLRNIHGFSQEEIAEKIGISRQAYAKWEKGESLPDIQKCAELAKIYGVSMDALYEETEKIEGVEILGDELLPAPKGKHIFGTVTLNENGQITIPKKAREIMKYEPGEKLLILGDEAQGIAIMKTKDFIKQTFEAIKLAKQKGE